MHFVYLSTDEQRIPEDEFDATCLSVPRIGENIHPHAGSKKFIVHDVYHRFIKNEFHDNENRAHYITVVLKELS